LPLSRTSGCCSQTAPCLPTLHFPILHQPPSPALPPICLSTSPLALGSYAHGNIDLHFSSSILSIQPTFLYISHLAPFRKPGPAWCPHLAMPYVSSDGTVRQVRPWARASLLSDVFWGIVNFVGLFFSTLFNPVDPATRKPAVPARPRRGWGGGGGGGGDGGGPRRSPKTGGNIRGMDNIKAQAGACGAAGG